MAERRVLQVTPFNSLPATRNAGGSIGARRRRVASFTIGGLVIGAGLFWVCWKAAAFGHGTYLPAIALFPLAMALAILQDLISPLLIGLALAQFPAYGFLLGREHEAGTRLRLAWKLGAIHLLAAVGAAAIALLKDGFRP